MKKLLIYLLSATILFAAGCSEPYDDSVLIGRVDNLENRVAKLEELCKQMNTNISSLQTLINALQNNDYVTGVTPITKDGETIGYTITFTKSKPITIYHGEDGKAGVNGTDGQDGHTPIIGVKQDTDGIYYWTLDGDWLLDDNGDKIKAQGTDGKDGENGEDGKDGVDGTDGKDGKDGVDGTDGKDGEDGEDGKDGITPQLKIENDYWYISYDNGKTWIQLGKAKGDDGQNGDNIFNNVTYDNDNVYFELNDGTVITLSRGMNLTSIIKDIVYIPRYSDGVAVVEDSGLYGVVPLDFEISPSSAVAELAQVWEKVLNVKAVYTETRVVSLIDMPIVSFETDIDSGVISIAVSCENLSDDFFCGLQSASVRVAISDGDASITSEYIPVECDEEVPIVPYLTFKADEVQTLTLSNEVETLEYSVDGTEWELLGTKTISFGGELGNLRVRGMNPKGTADNFDFYSYEDPTKYAKIVFGNDVDVSCLGDIRTLVDYKNYAYANTEKSQFSYLFADCTNLISAPKLPSTVLADYCYCYMFSGCSKLTVAPILPATTLSDSCYHRMFADCTSLISAPDLFAEATASNSYKAMFYNCSSLVHPPKISAKVIGYDCCFAMFAGCSSLKYAPELPATTLNMHCYDRMFLNCTSLERAPELPATILRYGCYDGMFIGCTNLVSAPVLHAKKLEYNCYNSMFSGCSMLNTVTMLATDISEGGLSGWLEGTAKEGILIKSSEMTELERGSHFPYWWTLQNYEE